MVKVKRIDVLPPNFDDLPRDLHIAIEEDTYRRQLKWSHGYCPGDLRLSTMSADGVPLSAGFGKASEVDDERTD